MKLAYNPFDFANPVDEKELFVGRQKELDDIRYYLDEMRSAPRPINLALLGPRAAGKTSFLNIIQIEATSREYLSVRIDLNEGDVKSEYDFFFKLFDAVAIAAFERGAWGGTSGKTYDTYLEIAYAHKVPESKDFCPFLFPIQCAKVLGATAERGVSDSSLKHDLLQVHRELKVPVVLLFDECNVLAESRVLLEKLRNLFMNTPGFMLVLTGTPDLFPVMDDVFSPIIRQFKKIAIGAFSGLLETAECIRRPLSSIKVPEIEALIDLDEDSEELQEIHDLSGGRPYEIKLICHFLFKRVQSGKATRMTLDLSVLEDVRQELASSQDLSKRPVLRRIQALPLRDLLHLAILCALDGRLSFEDVWSAFYLFHGTKLVTEHALKSSMTRLVELNIIGFSSDAKIEFKGDEFDKFYTKYLAQERKIRVPFWFTSARSFAEAQMDSISRVRGIVRASSEPPDDSDIAEVAQMFTDGRDPFSGRVMGSVLFERFSAAGERSHLLFADVKLKLWKVLEVRYLFSDRTSSENRNLETVYDNLKACADRSNSSCSLSLEYVSVPIPTHDQLLTKIRQTSNVFAKREAASRLVNSLGRDYLDGKIRECDSHVSFLSELADDDDDGKIATNVGYYMLAQGRLEEAEQLLIRPSVQVGDETKVLRRYNQAMLRVKQQRLEQAKELLDGCVAELKANRNGAGCICLFEPRVENGMLALHEIRDNNLDLLDVAGRAAKTLHAFLSEPKDGSAHSFDGDRA